MLIINVLSDYCKIYEVFHFELLNKIEDLQYFDNKRFNKSFFLFTKFNIIV